MAKIITLDEKKLLDKLHLGMEEVFENTEMEKVINTKNKIVSENSNLTTIIQYLRLDKMGTIQWPG